MFTFRTNLSTARGWSDQDQYNAGGGIAAAIRADTTLCRGLHGRLAIGNPLPSLQYGVLLARENAPH